MELLGGSDEDEAIALVYGLVGLALVVISLVRHYFEYGGGPVDIQPVWYALGSIGLFVVAYGLKRRNDELSDEADDE